MERLAIEAEQKEQLSFLELTSSDFETLNAKMEKAQTSRSKKYTKNNNDILNSSTNKNDKKIKKKNQKLYCLCRTPYDKSKYVKVS
jgi:hypothetical protein